MFQNYFHEVVYPKLPVSLQNAVISAYGFGWRYRRLGGNFGKWLEECKAREYYTIDQWKRYQQDQLRMILFHAFESVPYYKELFNKIGLGKAEIACFQLADLRHIPLLEKQTLRELGTTELVSNMVSRGAQYFSSSGSTGTPVKILFSFDTDQRWQALYEARCRNWAGVSFKDKRAMIGGRRVVVGNKQQPPFHRVNWAEGQIYLSIYHLSRENYSHYYRAIKDHAPSYIVGYSASIYLLAQYLLDMKFRPLSLKAVIGSSEKLTMVMRNVISEAFQCPVFDSWSGIEACGLITEHSDGNLYVSPDSGVIEYLDRQGYEVRCGEEGEMVCTGFVNFDQPLIRYRIGDLAVPIEPSTSSGSIQMPKIKEIVGRVDDIVTLSDGRQFSSFNRFFADIEGIIETQVVQNRADSLLVNVVLDKSVDASMVKEQITRSIVSRIGQIRIEVTQLEQIPRMPNGKFRAVISKVRYEGS